MFRFVAILLLVLAAGCAQPTAPDRPGTGLPVIRLSPEPTAFSAFSAAETSQQLVVRDPAALAQWWADAWRTMSHPPVIPDVDFTREMIVIATLGARPTSGYDIVIESATVENEGVVVVIRTSVSTAGTILPVVTHPVDIAKLPRRSEAVRFELVAS
jgi:hypothetical protein